MLCIRNSTVQKFCVQAGDIPAWVGGALRLQQDNDVRVSAKGPRLGERGQESEVRLNKEAVSRSPRVTKGDLLLPEQCETITGKCTNF